MATVQLVPEILNKQLALAVRSIQWSYAIFWSTPATQAGFLEWGGGYYNGDIKTRKTIKAGEMNPDPLGLKRSEELRQLYETLSTGDGSPHTRRPSAALSPEDLSDTEWYYLVCMSFVFNIGQGLPGRTLASGRIIWLCNAHNTDSKLFIRSLLAKSASIQISEDLSLIQQVKTSFLDVLSAVIPYEANADVGCEEHDDEFACDMLDPSVLDPQVSPLMSCDQGEMISPGKSSEPDELAEDIFLIQGTNAGVSQVENLQFMDEEFHNCVQHSLTSSDCISETFAEHGTNCSIQQCGTCNDHSPMDVEEWKHNRLISLNANADDLPYRAVLAALLKTSDQLVLGPYFRNLKDKSSFTIWKKNEKVNSRRDQKPQKVLKNILFEVPRMHDRGLLESAEASDLKDAVWTAEANELCASHVFSERKGRDKISERFSILKSLIPSDIKADKISILDDAIEYVQELEKRVRELEACRKVIDGETWTKRKARETFEQTSDNYGTTRINGATKPLINKRKTCDRCHEDEPEMYEYDSEEAQADNVTVTMNKNKDILIEIMCASREGILLDIMDAVSNLRLDCHSIQSSITEGIMSLKIKSIYKGASIASARTIKCSLQKVVWKF